MLVLQYGMTEVVRSTFSMFALVKKVLFTMPQTMESKMINRTSAYSLRDLA